MQRREFGSVCLAAFVGAAAMKQAGAADQKTSQERSVHAEHPGIIVPVLPAALAMAEKTKASGRNFMLAYHVGVEVECKVVDAISHPAMTEMARLILIHNIQPEQVESVEVGANHAMLQSLLHHHPQTGLQAKFSMEFCMAILLLERRAGLAQFTNSVVRREDVKQMIDRVRYYVDPAAEAGGYDKMTSLLKITLKNGKAITGHATFGKGSPADPMSFDEVAEKFRGCAEYVGWSAPKRDAVITFVKTLETAPDVTRLSALLGG
jgi:2-methylcitrate dehydratase PrpD